MATETVQLIFQIKADNQAVLAALRQGVSGVNTELEKGAKVTASLTKSNGELVVSLKSVSAAESESAGARSRNTETMGAAVVKGILYSEAIMGAARALKEVTVESALYAARTQQLNTVMDQLARTNGLSVSAVRAQADAVKALGITTQESRETINRMIFAQLDLNKATDLARLSQNAAKIAGISSSEALNGIIAGIVEQRIQMLRTYGIQVSFEQAFIRGAAAIGKTRETLTDYERANIALNEVLAKGPRIMGTYEVSLTTAAGQMQSMKRYVDEARNALGEGFIPVLQRVVQFLTGATKDIQENAEAYQNLAKHITAVSLALIAARLTPGGPIPKTIVGIGVGIGAEVLGNVDVVEQHQKFAAEALAKVQENRQEVQQRFQMGMIADREEYLKEDQRLQQLQLTIEQNLTIELAKIYKKRREDAGQGGWEFQFRDTGFPFAIARGDRNRGLFRGNADQLSGDMDLGGGRKITRAQIEAAMAQVGKPIAPGGNLTITPDLASQMDSLLGAFTSRAKEALKAAQAGTARAGEGLLSGEAAVEAARTAALSKVAEEFRQFTTVFAETARKSGQVSDPKERAALEESIRTAQGKYGAIVSKINEQYNMELEKVRRNASADQIKRDQKLSDTKADIEVQQLRQRGQQAQQVARAQGQLDPAQEEKLINSLRDDRLTIAQREYEITLRRADTDLATARNIFALNRNDGALRDAESTHQIATVKAEAQLTKEKSDAEVDRQVQILELRRKQNVIIREAYENAFKIATTERDVINARVKDERDRAVQLASAQALPGNEGYIIRLQYQTRVQSAKEDYQITQQSIEERRKASIEEYIRTKDSKELERTATELRVEELKNAYKLEKDLADARMATEIEIANIRKQQSEELRATLGDLYDSLKSGGGFGEFFQNYLEKIKKTLFVNLGEELLRGQMQRLGGLIPGQEKIDPVTGKGTGELSPLGRILRGTPFGLDPVKLAQDRQINAQDRNTKALDRLSGVLTGAPSATAGAAGYPGGLGGAGGLGGILGGIFGGNGNYGGMVIKNILGGNGFLANSTTTAAGGIDMRPDVGFGGFMTGLQGFFSPKIDPDTGKGKFSPGYTALAAAAAVPAIISGIQRGGVAGGSQAVSAGLGVAATIPGPQQPFIAAASALAGLISMIAGFKNPYKEWEKRMSDRLSVKFQMPEAINLTEDLAGNSADFDYRGKLRTYQGQPSTTINVRVSTMDAKSFMDNGPMIAEATRAQFQLGHPLQSTIKDAVGVS
jgi:hypothetical protein